MALAIIIVHFVNVYVYTMPPIVVLLVAIFITYLGITFINKSGKFEQNISLIKYNLLNAIVVVVLFIVYFTITN
ncbi:hypothetical protein C7437_105106 [Psychrobacillus insolitus]|uniref:Uncharacterized protein n=2 Tax=Psychrobacillus insolitus TaxID=1461 RepID=A0A2W7MEA3_9BACI|nr:hypothetical protein C7437_105106 [Psychrobacillus insolitus]